MESSFDISNFSLNNVGGNQIYNIYNPSKIKRSTLEPLTHNIQWIQQDRNQFSIS